MAAPRQLVLPDRLPGPAPTCLELDYGELVQTLPAGAMVAHSDLAFVIDGRGHERDALHRRPRPDADVTASSFASLLQSRIDQILHFVSSRTRRRTGRRPRRRRQRPHSWRPWSSGPPRSAALGPAAPAGAAAPLVSAVSTAARLLGGRSPWAKLSDPANTFWQLFHAGVRSSVPLAWTLVTPPGAADNGGLVGGRLGGQTSRSLAGYCPTACSASHRSRRATTAGRPGIPLFVPGALAARPDALAYDRTGTGYRPWRSCAAGAPCVSGDGRLDLGSAGHGRQLCGGRRGVRRDHHRRRRRPGRRVAGTGHRLSPRRHGASSYAPRARGSRTVRACPGLLARAATSRAPAGRRRHGDDRARLGDAGGGRTWLVGALAVGHLALDGVHPTGRPGPGAVRPTVHRRRPADRACSSAAAHALAAVGTAPGPSGRGSAARRRRTAPWPWRRRHR